MKITKMTATLALLLVFLQAAGTPSLFAADKSKKAIAPAGAAGTLAKVAATPTGAATLAKLPPKSVAQLAKMSPTSIGKIAELERRKGRAGISKLATLDNSGAIKRMGRAGGPGVAATVDKMANTAARNRAAAR